MQSSRNYTAGEIIDREIAALEKKLYPSSNLHLEGGGTADSHLLDIANALAASRPPAPPDQDGQTGHRNAALLVASFGIAAFLVTLFIAQDHPNLPVILGAEGAIWMALIGLASKFLDTDSKTSTAQQARFTDIARINAMSDGIRSVAVMPGLTDEAKLAALKVLHAMAPPKGNY